MACSHLGRGARKLSFSHDRVSFTPPPPNERRLRCLCFYPHSRLPCRSVGGSHRGSYKECPAVEERYQLAGDLIHRLERDRELGPVIEPLCYLLVFQRHRSKWVFSTANHSLFQVRELGTVSSAPIERFVLSGAPFRRRKTSVS